MLLLILLTFITVVLIMTGALVPVFMYCAAVAAVLYVLLLIKRLVFDLLWPEAGETAPADSSQGDPALKKSDEEEFDEDDPR